MKKDAKKYFLNDNQVKTIMEKMLDESSKKVDKLRLDQYYGITAHHFGEDNENLTQVQGGNYISKSFAENRKLILAQANGNEPKSNN